MFTFWKELLCFASFNPAGAQLRVKLRAHILFADDPRKKGLGNSDWERAPSYNRSSNTYKSDRNATMVKEIFKVEKMSIY
ncbi:hypothetical protein F4782DRAFT_252316 [Xylaria castorea]|nr:hypothetical protein F4782DRAFT_252316 [Xylaria castorea]